MRESSEKRIKTWLGAAATLLVPAIVVAQSVSFGDGDTLGASQLNDLAEGADKGRAGACRVAIEVVGCADGFCSAVCPSAHVVTGGGCRVAPGGSLRVSRPGFSSENGTVDLVNGQNGELADSITQFGDPVAASLGVENGDLNSPPWDRFICGSASGNLEYAIAVCCPI